jgi:dienelactone hydrolase
VIRFVCAAALLLQLACLAWLGCAERGGPPHADLILPSGVPATFYFAGRSVPGPFGLPEPPGAGNGPPVVLLVHGYTADRASMGVLARRLANAGYAVLAIDVRGHGANPRPFAQDPEGANLFEDLAGAADWLRASSWVDGSRLAVMGHSMGAAAALRFAERDVGVDAAVMISGGWMLLGPLRPPNALFIYASWDPASLRDAAARVAARLAGADGGEVGAFEARDAVRAVEMPGNDHTTILWSRAAAREIVSWLDASFATARNDEVDLAEPRAPPAFLAAALLPFTLTGLGLALGALAPVWPRREGSLRGLRDLALGLAAALPLVAAAPPAGFLGLDVADALGALLLFAGLLVCAGAALRGEALLAVGGRARALLVGLAGFAAAYALLAPLFGLVHDVTPGPARVLRGLALTLLLFPFFLGFEHCVRRGGTLAALGAGLLGRLVTLGVIALGIALGVVPWIVTLLFGPLVVITLLAELVAAALHAAGGNRLASAAFQAALLAWLMAATLPLRV